LVGLLLLLWALMGIAFGNLYKRVGRVSLHSFPLWLAIALPFFFGHDRWHGEAPFRELFHTLFVLAMDRDASASVVDYWERAFDTNFGPCFCSGWVC